MLEHQCKYSNDRLVSSVTFGFWTYLFNRIPFRGGGMNLLQIFPNRTHGLAQRPIYNELQEIKTFRNLIAHHEAICFNSTGEIDLNYAQGVYISTLRLTKTKGDSTKTILPFL